MSDRAQYRFPFIRPLVPPIERWSPYLEPAYATKWFSNFGPVSRQFEAGLTRRLCHAHEIITCANNATSGIAACLIALQVRGAVLIPAYTFPATASAVMMAGAQPWVTDVDLETWCLSASFLEHALSIQTFEAIVLVKPFGMRLDLSRHFEICADHGLPLVIDNASGLGLREDPLPSERCFEVYSLHATKAFPIGEGGAIRSLSSCSDTLQRALNFGLQRGVAQPGRWGINGKLPEVSAAIGLAVLEKFDEVTAHRRMVAQGYIDLLSEFNQVANPTETKVAPWQFFPVLLPSAAIAEKFIAEAAARSVQVGRGYNPSLEDWPGTKKLSPCKNARSLAERMVLLPVYSDATAQEMEELPAIARDTLTAVLSG